MRYQVCDVFSWRTHRALEHFLTVCVCVYTDHVEQNKSVRESSVIFSLLLFYLTPQLLSANPYSLI